MPRRTAGRRPSRARRAYEGWDLVDNVVPGDVVGAMEALNMKVLRVDESGEAHARCPAHMEILGREDSHPSFSVNMETGVFGCWSCGFRGKFPELVARVLKISYGEAVEWTRARGTVERVFRLFAKKRQEPVDTSTQVNEASLALMVPPPRKALRERGLTAGACELYGVLWDPERDMWITPVRDTDGTLLGWQEKNKKFFRNVPDGVKKSKIVFGLQVLPKRCRRVVIVESPLDAVKIASAGISYAVSSYGAGVSDSQMQLILERAEHVVIFMDNDGPGIQARNRLMNRWRGRGMGVSFVDYRLLQPLYEEIDGLDPGDLGDDDLDMLVNNAVPASIAAITLSRAPRSR